MFAKSTAVNRLGSATSHRRLEKMSGKSQEKSWEKVKKKMWIWEKLQGRFKTGSVI